MKTEILAALTIGLLITSNVQADCPDITKDCPAGAVGWQGQKWHWWPPGCSDTGTGFCPKPPLINDMPRKAESECRVKLLSKIKSDGCSWEPKDPASKSFKHVFDEGPCYEHDICYTTPGMKKSECDDNFRVNMIYACKSYYYNQIKSHPFLVPLNASQLGLCDTAAPFWETAVILKGAQAYADDQVIGTKICNE